MSQLSKLAFHVFAVAILVSATRQAAYATSIGLNFSTDGSGANFDLAAGDTTGVVPQQHWNNAHNNDLSLVNLVDDRGTATAASASWNHAPQSTSVPGG